MATKSRTKNPFYPVLVLVGLAFAITACGFAVMMVRDMNGTGQLEAETNGLIPFFQKYGFTLLMIELGALALATFGAITTDEMWADRARTSDSAETTPEPEETAAPEEAAGELERGEPQ